MLNYIGFEWRYFTRQPSFYVTSILFFLIAFFASASANVSFGSGGDFFKNSAFAIGQMFTVLNIFAIFLCVNFVGNTATRNSLFQMEQLISTKPLKPLQYQLGRFAGSFLVVAAVFLWVPLGHILGSLMWWVDAERFGPVHVSHYLHAYLYLSLPTLLVLSSLFYAMATKFKSMMALYLAAIALFGGYSIAGGLMGEPQYRDMAALLDPFGLNTWSETTRYWTSVEKNNADIALSGILLKNRALWICVSVAIFFLMFSTFKKMPSISKERASKPNKSTQPVFVAKKYTDVDISPSAWLQFKTRALFECKQVFFSAPFIILLLLTIALLVMPLATGSWKMWAEMDVLPVTHKMMAHIGNSTGLFIAIVVIYYSAEIVWRERTIGIADVIDSRPIPNFVLWSSKLMALVLIVAALFFLSMLVTLSFQLIKGYTSLELSQYALRLAFFMLLPWVMNIVLAFFLQVISPNKYVGMLAFVAYFIISLTLSSWGFSHNQFHFAQAPDLVYSDMNGYGWNLLTHSVYMIYWSGLTLVLFALGYGLVHRGPQQSLKYRLSMLGHHLGFKGKAAIAFGLCVFMGMGSYIYYSTRVQNQYFTSDQQMDRQSDYEKKYRQFKDDPYLTVTKVNAKVDIFPDERRINAKVDFQFKNKSSKPIKKILVNLPQNTPTIQIDIAGASLTDIDMNRHIAWLNFEKEVDVGQEISGSVSLSRENHGIRDSNPDSNLVENGTFIDYTNLLPTFGYLEQSELTDKHERRKRNLPARKQGNSLSDASHYREQGFGAGVGYIDFEATVSTSADQTAIAPGYLQKEWRENNRHYFHYKMDAPMINFYSFLSARLAVKKETYKGIELAVYYHPAHEYNVSHMLEAMRDSLDYATHAFGPFQFHQMRIIEFPQYATFAQSFPNTVPYSESLGFIADLSDREKIDMVYYVTAHEVAHQWWGHQVTGANVQGAAALSESLAQYTALNVMEKKYGAEKMRIFLKYELDNYLSGRATESLDELPLALTYGQPYVHYNKGSIVMNAIKNRIGEDKLNNNLKSFLNAFKYASNPYPTTNDLRLFLKQDTEESDQIFIDDQFSKITLYDLAIGAVSVVDAPNHQFKVAMDITAKQLSANGKGVETEQPMNEPVEIGLFSIDPNKLNGKSGMFYLQKHAIKTGVNHIELLVSEKPVFIGVDPLVKLIDRDSANNIKRL